MDPAHLLPRASAGARSRMNVVAVILTYNSPETVCSCVAANVAQTRRPDLVLVVDNAGWPTAEDSLRKAGLRDEVELLRTSDNLGPAGGFAAGIRWAMEHGADAAWVMDDDCLPDAGCLDRLLDRAKEQPEPTVVFPQEIDGRDGSKLNYPAWAAVLIPRQVIEAVGLPREEFFWWMEDTEYLHYRMQQYGKPVIRDEVARVVHQRARRAGSAPAWKLYYETRNSTYMRQYVIRRGKKAWRRRIVRRFGYIIVKSPHRLTDLRAFLTGFSDGYRQRLGKRYPVP